MSFSTATMPGESAVEIVVEGDLCQDDRKNVLMQAANILCAGASDRLLLDITRAAVPREPTMSDALDLVLYMGDLHFPKHARVALVYREKDKLLVFFESAAQCGGYTLKTFVSKDRAPEWLCGG